MADFSDVLFVSDFDHTMTGTDGTIPLANRRAIAAFTARGGCVTVCTGRSLPLFRSMLPQLPVNAPVILFNGGLCYDFARQAALFSYPIELDARALAADLLRRYPDVLLEVQAEETHYCLRPDANLEEFCRISQCPIHCLPPEKMPRSIMKLALYQDFRSPDVGQLFEITPDEETFFAEVAAYLNTQYAGVLSAVRSAPRVVDIQAAQATKGQAARRLAQLLGKKILAVAGDSQNDLSMLDAADLAFVPADASIDKTPYCEVAPCSNGSVASAIAMLETLL